jgi:hypothetical protein
MSNSIKQRLRPKTKKYSSAIDDTQSDRGKKNVGVGELGLDEVGTNHSPNSVRIHQADIQAEWDQVVLKDGRVEIEISRHKDPSQNKRKKAVEGLDGVLSFLLSNLHDMGYARANSKKENKRAVNEIPLSKRDLIDSLRNEPELGDTDGLEHGLMPKAAPSHVCSDSKDNTKRQYAFNGSRYNPKRQDLGIVHVPGLNVECHGSYDTRSVT